MAGAAPTLQAEATLADGLGVAALLALVALAAWRAPWWKLRGDAEAQHVLFAGIAAALLARASGIEPVPGLALHFLIAPAACLLYGPAVAILVGVLASVVAALAGWPMAGPVLLDPWLSAVLPVAAMQGLLRLAQRRLPPNTMVFVMLNAFGGAALAVLAAGLARAALLASGLVGPGAGRASEGAVAGLLAALPLQMFAEAFLTGGLLAIVVAYRPRWCASFDDARYLAPPRGDAGDGRGGGDGPG